MKLNRASTYALHALAYMAELKENHAVASHDIARARGIPERFLLKVLKPLVSQGILRSMKGPHGGYRLGRPVAKITLLEVIEAVEGPIRYDLDFAEGKGNADMDGKLQGICEQATAVLRKQLAAVSVAALAGKKK